MGFRVRKTLVIAVGAGLLAAGCVGDNETPQSELDDYEPGTVDELECMPDLDEQIRADQLQPAFDIPVTYRVSPAGQQRPIDLAGHTIEPTGERVWDLSATDGDYANDQSLEVVATEIDDRWYADDFEDGEFATILDPSTAIEAIYSHDGDTLYLHGYASAEEDPEIGQTLVPYAEPVVAYDFPVEVGDSWSDTGEAHNAVVRDLPYSASEHYEFEVDASGQLWLPDIQFQQVLRVRTSLTIDMALGNPIYREQVQYLFECFGEVARLVGPDREIVDGDEFEPGEEVRQGSEAQDYDFDRTVEMRRLGF